MVVTARRGDVVVLAGGRIGFRAGEEEVLAVVVQNDALSAVATRYVIVPVDRCPTAPADFPPWVSLEGEAGLAGRWVATTDEIRRVPAAMLAPGVRARLSRDAMRRIDKALRWVLAL